MGRGEGGDKGKGKGARAKQLRAVARAVAAILTSCSDHVTDVSRFIAATFVYPGRLALLAAVPARARARRGRALGARCVGRKEERGTLLRRLEVARRADGMDAARGADRGGWMEDGTRSRPSSRPPSSRPAHPGPILRSILAASPILRRCALHAWPSVRPVLVLDVRPVPIPSPLSVPVPVPTPFACVLISHL